MVEQATQLVNAGYKEIVLTGIHTGGYGQDLKDYNLAQLLRDLEEIDGLERIRISSIEASQLTDEVIDVLKRSNKVVRHLHVPLQSGSDTVLKRMRRKYTMEHFSERITKLHDALPNLAVTSDVIVGFPGETEENSKKLMILLLNTNSLNYMSSLIQLELVHLLLVWMIKLMKLSKMNVCIN